MNAEHVNPFVLAIKDTFRMMCGVSVVVGSPEVKDDDGDFFDISSTLEFRGTAEGSISLCFATEAATRIATAFARSDTTLTQKELDDPIGELANIVAGCAKARFEGHNIRVSIPKIRRRRHQITGASRDVPHLVLPCQTPVGGFVVELDMVLRSSVERV